MLETALPGGDLYRCKDCHVRFRWPLPDPAQLEALYQQVEAAHWQYETVHRYDWNAAKVYIESHFTGGAVLDVGCFDGAFLKSLDPRFRRVGIEINDAAAALAETHDVTLIGRDATELAQLDELFEVVASFDVIEHVPSPQHMLEQMVQRTRPGGAVILATGNADAPTWRWMGSRYWYCALSEHLAFIGEKWCVHQAERLGLRLARLERFSHDFDRTLPRFLVETAKNVLYRVSPGAAGWLRAHGAGEIDVARDETLKLVPPMWTTARDHLIVIFERP